MTKKPTATGEQQFQLPPLNLKDMRVSIIGDTPLLVHAWSEKAKRQMLEAQTKKATRGRETRDPDADYRSSIYRLPDGSHGIPSVGLKNAAVTACTSIASVTKVAARQAFFILGQRSTSNGAHQGALTSDSLVPLLGLAPPNMHEALVRVGMGNADLRWRAEYFPWACEFIVRFNERALSAEQVINLIDTAGFAVGINEWRPEKSGDLGRFHVARDDDKAFLKQAKPIFDAKERGRARG